MTSAACRRGITNGYFHTRFDYSLFRFEDEVVKTAATGLWTDDSTGRKRGSARGGPDKVRLVLTRATAEFGGGDFDSARSYGLRAAVLLFVRIRTQVRRTHVSSRVFAGSSRSRNVS